MIRIFETLVSAAGQADDNAVADPPPLVAAFTWLLHNPSVIISVIALGFAISTFFVNRWKDKRDLFLKIHERQLDPELQRGRRLLHEHFADTDVPSFDGLKTDAPDDYAQINRAVAMLDVMGLYADKRYVKKSLVINEWGQSLSTIAPKARLFIEHRSIGSTKAWPHLTKLLEKAEKKYPKQP